MTHSGEMSLTEEEEGLFWERRWLVFFVNLTKLHSSSGYLSPEVGRAGLAEDVKYARERAYPNLGGLQRRMELSQKKKQLCLQPAACSLCLRVPACLSWWLALLILDLLT